MTESLSGLRAYTYHIRQCGACLIPGARDWFLRHDLVWRDFVRDGIAVEALEVIDDIYAKTIVAKVREEASR